MADYGRIPARYVIIETPFCNLRYGIGACPAVLGVDSPAKCFNTLATCPVPASYDPSDSVTFALTDIDQNDLPSSIRAIPSIVDIQQQAAEISVGGANRGVSALGLRPTLTITVQDHAYSDLNLDPYVDERAYDPLRQGTFWGKWKARNRYRQGLPIIYVTGYVEAGQFVEVNRHHYRLDRVDGPDSGDRVVIRCVDLIAQLGAEQALFPPASPGALATAISDTDTSFTLEPADVGAEYPAEFRCRIGGEGLNVTRSGDVCTITSRGLYGGAEEHDAGDSVQVVAQMSGQVNDLAYEIITESLPELANNIEKPAWDSIAADHLPRVYSADITEPTPVEQLLAELAEAAPVYWYTDTRTDLIVMEAIREPAQVAVDLTDRANILDGTLAASEYPDERVDEIWVYYRIRDAAGSPTDEDNYSQRFILINPVEQLRHGRRAIRRVFTRWIAAGGRDTAEEIAQRLNSRFQTVPVKIAFDLDAKDAQIWLGDLVKPLVRSQQEADGSLREINYQIISAAETSYARRFSYVAQSYEFFGVFDPDSITISITPEDNQDALGNTQAINLRELYDSVVATEIPNITFRVLGGSQGTIVGAPQSFAVSGSMIVPDDWPWSPDIELVIENGGGIAGAGGIEGTFLVNGGPGGDALVVQYPITLNNLGGIAGGGGGGGAGGTITIIGPEPIEEPGGNGGGGAGKDRSGGATLTDGGPGQTSPNGDGGDGGDLGQPGQSGSGNAASNGGPPGRAILGDSFITYINSGTIIGSVE